MGGKSYQRYFERRSNFEAMLKYNTYQVIFTNNEILSIKEVDEPKFVFPDKVYVSSTRFHLILAFIKAHSVTKAIREAEWVINKFLQKE
jgi:hypothetical protein